ncbi:MAG: transposase [Nitrososphaerota archaeon]|nr:transposase [Nitrososphaerota archaeon]
MTTYQKKTTDSEPLEKAIGIDFGVKRQAVFSNGVAVEAVVPLTKRVRRLHRELSRRKLYGKNWMKTNTELNREYERITNRRRDMRRKVTSYIVSNYDCVATQKDNVAGWQRLWGRRVASSSIGGIMSGLRTKPRTPVVVGRFEPTTQGCCWCSSKNKMGLGARVYKCETCGLVIDRDLNAAINIWSQIPAERRESTPVDTKAATWMLEYFNSIPNVSASLVVEAGSHPTFSRW